MEKMRDLAAHTAFLIVALAFMGFVRGYETGDDITLCWVTNETSGVRVRESCGGASVTFQGVEQTSFWEGKVYEKKYSATVPATLSPSASIPHANIHSCVRTVGFCTPFVSNTPGLATHSTALTGVISNDEVSFTSDVSLDAGQYTMIAHVRWYDTSGRRHDMARAAFADVKREPTAVIVSVSLGVALLVLVMLVCIVQGRAAIRRYKKLQLLAMRAFDLRVKRVHRVCAESSNLAFPMACISYAHFRAHGKFSTYEEARARGELQVFDTSGDVQAIMKTHDIVFVSHAWKGTKEPDPTRCDFGASSLPHSYFSLAFQPTHPFGLEHAQMRLWQLWTS